MAENSFNILLGVVSGVLTAFTLWTLTGLWTDTLRPLFRQWRYQGVRISGEWKGLGASPAPAAGEWSEVSLALEQDAFDLRGLMTIRYRSEVHSFDLNLKVTGRVWEGYVALSLTPVSRTNASVATALLKIDGGGLSLNGQFTYRNAFLDRVDAINMSVHRAESIAAPRLRSASIPVPSIRTAAVQPVAAASLASE